MRTLNNPFNWNTAATFHQKWHAPVHPVFPEYQYPCYPVSRCATLYGILSVTAGDNISAGYGHWQFPRFAAKLPDNSRSALLMV